MPPFSSAFYVCRNGRLRQIEGFDATSDGVLGYRHIRCHRFVTDNQVEEYRAKVLDVSNRNGDYWHFQPNSSPLDRGGFIVSATPLSGKPSGVGYWWRREVLTESIGKSYPWAVGFFLTNPELSIEI